MRKSIEPTEFDKKVANHFFTLTKDQFQIKALIKKRWEQPIINEAIDTIRKLRTIDGLTEENIKSILRFVTTDDFWKKQVRILSKIRKSNKEWIPYYALFLDILEEKKQSKVEHKAKSSNLNVWTIGKLNKPM